MIGDVTAEWPQQELLRVLHRVGRGSVRDDKGVSEGKGPVAHFGRTGAGGGRLTSTAAMSFSR